MTDAIFISWIRHHGRSAALAAELGIQSRFITGGSGNPARRYIRAWFETRKALAAGSARPSHAIVMLPPTPALLAAASLGAQLRLAGDLHSGVFNDPKWKWALPLTLRMLRRRGLAIVTNEALARVCRQHGVRTIVMHDPLETYSGPIPALVTQGLIPETYVMLPVTYAHDEPIAEVLQAARLAPDSTFVLTGKAPADVRRAAPTNVVFTGFVTDEDFLALLRNAGAIAALTTRPHTMQRAGYEALSANIPLITSPHDVLIEYFGDAALYAAADASDIAQAAQHALRHRKELNSRMAALKAVRMQEQDRALTAIREWLEDEG